MSKKFKPSDATSASQIHKVLAGTRYIENEVVMRLEDIVKYNSIDELFGERYYKVLFVTGEGDIGHWVLLTHLENKNLEYFDSLGFLPPQILTDWGEKVGVEDLSYSRVILQHKDSYNCGRFVLARISSQPTPFPIFLDLLRSSKLFSPDELVGYLFNVDSEEINP